MNRNAKYAAYGETMLDTFGLTRQSYIGKEKEPENNLGDHGVRKYDYETGRFNSIDPLFEKYYGWSPYQYSMNNPIWAKDWNGKFQIKMTESEMKQYPNFVSIVKDYMPTLANNVKFLQAMKEITGVSTSKIKESLQFGKGPLLHLKDSKGHWHGMTSDSKNININIHEVNNLEKKDRHPLEPSIEAQTLFIINLLSHELTQALWFSNSNRNFNFDNPGEEFEKIFHGFTIQSSAAMQKNFDKINDAYRGNPESKSEMPEKIEEAWIYEND